MNASALPLWRRTPTRRAACVLIAALPALALQALRLDAAVPLRAGLLCLIALATAGLLRALPRRSRGAASFDLIDAALAALLLAALWPTAAPIWPAATALAGALAAARLLGGVSVNPFPPAALALALATAIAQLGGLPLAPERVLLPDVLLTAGLWLAGALALVALGLARGGAVIAFLLPVAFAVALGDLPAMGLIAAALAAGFLLGEPRYLPATASGRIAVAALAGCGTAIAWLRGAPPAAVGAAIVLACALGPWIENLTVTTKPAGGRAP